MIVWRRQQGYQNPDPIVSPALNELFMQSVALAPKTAEIWDFMEPGEEAVWTLGTASEKRLI